MATQNNALASNSELWRLIANLSISETFSATLATLKPRCNMYIEQNVISREVLIYKSMELMSLLEKKGKKNRFNFILCDFGCSRGLHTQPCKKVVSRFMDALWQIRLQTMSKA